MRKLEAAQIPAVGEGKRGIEGHIAYLLRQANAAVRLRLERALAEHGLTLPQFMAMTMLRAYPGISGAELARVALITAQTVGVITGNLEKQGLLQKSPAAHSRRILQLRLTPKGERLLTTCRDRIDLAETRLTAGLPKRDEAIIRSWLVKLASESEEMPPRL